MHIGYQLHRNNLVFTATPDDADIRYNETLKGKLARRTISFTLPTTPTHFDAHPDLLALACLLVYGPFAAREITFTWPVSSYFAEAVHRNFKRSIGPIAKTSPPRARPDNGRDALAFSGGVDSVAALKVMPDVTLPIFMNRTTPSGEKPGLYRAAAALESCNDVRLSGRECLVIDTTMEYARAPVGFSVDWTNSTGAVMLADVFDLKSVAFGMIQESALFIGHPHYSDLQDRGVYRIWKPLFDAVGLPIALPTSGVSEVGTSLIAKSVSTKWRAQSCVRGDATNPCMKCFKCFRKKILDARLSNKYLDAKHFDIAYNAKEVKRRLLEVPIHHENVLAYSLHGLKSAQHPVRDALEEKMALVIDYNKGLSFLERVNPTCSKYLPDDLKDVVRKRLSAYLHQGTSQDVAAVEGWDTRALNADRKYLAANAKLETELGAI